MIIPSTRIDSLLTPREGFVLNDNGGDEVSHRIKLDFQFGVWMR